MPAANKKISVYEFTGKKNAYTVSRVVIATDPRNNNAERESPRPPDNLPQPAMVGSKKIKPNKMYSIVGLKVAICRG